MIGDVDQSYVKNITVHETFNRAMTIHGVNNLLIEHCTAVNIRGLAFFVEVKKKRFILYLPDQYHEKLNSSIAILCFSKLILFSQ